ncbi:hypothetical protein [Paenibacillus sp. YN15]|nr:hypothetical protein [Paenibacillus sp. YN15]
MSKIGIAIGSGQAFALPSSLVAAILILALIGLRTVLKQRR